MRAVLFLAVTALAVILELVHALDGDPGTVPWTGYLIRLPWWLLIPAVVGFAAWLPLHLVRAKRKREGRG